MTVSKSAKKSPSAKARSATVKKAAPSIQTARVAPTQRRREYGPASGKPAKSRSAGPVVVGVKKFRAGKITAISIAARPEAYQPSGALSRVVEVLGKSGTARMLGVSKSQPGRWLTGDEGMSADHQSAVIDLDGFVAQVLKVLTPAQSSVWLDSPNSFLGGATPLASFHYLGLSGVLPAIEGQEQGTYA